MKKIRVLMCMLLCVILSLAFVGCDTVKDNGGGNGDDGGKQEVALTQAQKVTRSSEDLAKVYAQVVKSSVTMDLDAKITSGANESDGAVTLKVQKKNDYLNFAAISDTLNYYKVDDKEYIQTENGFIANPVVPTVIPELKGLNKMVEQFLGVVNLFNKAEMQNTLVDYVVTGDQTEVTLKADFATALEAHKNNILGFLKNEKTGIEFINGFFAAVGSEMTFEGIMQRVTDFDGDPESEEPKPVYIKDYIILFEDIAAELKIDVSEVYAFAMPFIKAQLPQEMQEMVPATFAMFKDLLQDMTLADLVDLLQLPAEIGDILKMANNSFIAYMLTAFASDKITYFINMFVDTTGMTKEESEAYIQGIIDSFPSKDVIKFNKLGFELKLTYNNKNFTPVSCSVKGDVDVITDDFSGQTTEKLNLLCGIDLSVAFKDYGSTLITAPTNIVQPPLAA